jgi:hypothetical protein
MTTMIRMVIRTNGYELRRVVHERERLPVEGISARIRTVHWLTILGNKRRLGIGC